ncbi:MAG: amidohydrolase family protein [Deltaproteobacteria bacterium]|nr:amidohydrolase family protein [Deltaproteobacteria bacterium]
MLPLLYSEGVRKGRFPLTQLVRLVSENPARLFGMYPEKGTISVGSDADLTVFDPGLETVITPGRLQTNCDYSPYEGMVVHGWPVHTLVRGQLVVENRSFVGRPGYGRFLARKPLP